MVDRSVPRTPRKSRDVARYRRSIGPTQSTEHPKKDNKKPEAVGGYGGVGGGEGGVPSDLESGLF